MTTRVIAEAYIDHFQARELRALFNRYGKMFIGGYGNRFVYHTQLHVNYNKHNVYTSWTSSLELRSQGYEDYYAECEKQLKRMKLLE